MKQEPIRLAIIIPVYSNWEDTMECLRQLLAQTERPFRILVADDGSPEPPPAGLSSLDSVEYFRYPHAGFAANCNHAAAEAAAAGATHLLFLNNDTSFGPAFVSGWQRVAESLPDAIVSPVIYWFDRPAEIWTSGANYSVWLPVLRFRRDFRQVTAVDAVCGCALLVAAGVWQRLHGFETRYVTYFEDFDLTLRARRMGIPVLVDPHPDLRVWHKVSRSSGGRDSWERHYRMLTSSLIFIRTHYSGLARFVAMALKAAHVASLTVAGLPRLPSAARLWAASREGLSR